MKALVYLFILALIFFSCNKHHSDITQEMPDVSIDPWQPDQDFDTHKDEKSVQPMPEPSTLMLVGGGTVILMLRRKKNGRSD